MRSATVPQSALGFGPPRGWVLCPCLQVGDSLINISGPGWQHSQRPVLGGEADLWTLEILQARGWGVDLGIQKSSSWSPC